MKSSERPYKIIRLQTWLWRFETETPGCESESLQAWLCCSLLAPSQRQQNIFFVANVIYQHFNKVAERCLHVGTPT
jgi:hypothetical protein